MRRGKLGLTFAVLAVMLASGCTGQAGDPPTTEPPSPSVTPSPTPTPTPTPEAAIPPERPDMSQVDEATAEAVFTYFLKLYPYVYATGDLTEWRSLSHPECVFCASVITHVEEMVAKGNANDGSLITLGEVETLEVTDGEWFSVEGEFQEGPSVERDPGGTVVDERPTPDDLHFFAAVTHDGAWSVREVDVAAADAAP
ncbi:DUF6318 family protein [Actinotalea subterranea]|uniref:DUF6318 family protein n=1 Tax=Actinotalea subterranea TaxID=2607497 RepID=UPI0011EF35EF|nr:DUF6318 family protein [Actinotalea subterranea]